LAESTLPESEAVETVSPSLHFGAIHAARSTWLGPIWAALCGLVASAAFKFDGPSLLVAAFVWITADWAWPALWTTCVRTDWLAVTARWRETPTPERLGRLPYFQSGSPGDRLLAWLARLGQWRRTILMPMAGASLLSGLAALIIGLFLSTAIGWRALALTLAVVALTGIGAVRAGRAGIDPDGLRSLVYSVLPWWLGHTAYAPLTVESAALSALFGLAHRAVMVSGEHTPSAAGLVLPQMVVAVALFAAGEIVAALIVSLAIGAQIALRTFLADQAFARRAQGWLMAAMLVGAIAVT
jgi:hypothetical protein